MSPTKAMSPRSAFWLAWSVCALSLALTALGLLFLALNQSHSGAHIFTFWLENTVAATGFSTVGAVIISRRTRNVIGWLLNVAGLFLGLNHFSSEYAIYSFLARPGSLPGDEVVAWLAYWLFVPSVALVVFLLLLFPTGRLPSSRWRWFAGFSVLAAWIAAVSMAFSSGMTALGPVPNPLGIESVRGVDRIVEPFLFTLLLLAASSMFVRLRGATEVERQQIKWFAYAAAVAVSGNIMGHSLFVATNAAWVWWVGFIPGTVGVLGMPVAMGIAILRYRLYDIDLVINRTLVYGALTACVVGIYVLVVGALGALFQARGNFGVSLLATGAVALLFQPLRSRLQRGVNRLMYGERDDPYAVISRLGQRLEATLEPRAILPTIAETVAQALKLPYVAIALKQKKNPAHEKNGGKHAAEQAGEEDLAVAASWGSPVDYPPLRLPLSYGQETIGELILAPRTRGEDFSPADRRLLEDIARQTEVAAYAVRLTDDLQRARERLVSTREEERRRLRRDLHDGLGPQLSGQALTIDAIRSLLKRDPTAAEELLVDLKAQTRGAAADIRLLVYALRPPALDSLGLVGALRRRGTQCEQDGSLRVCVEAPEDLPPLPAAVEVACYRIAEEALTNVVRHAEAQRCTLSIAIDGGALRLEVRDDGRGLPDSHAGQSRRAGVGLTSMRERAAELGGGLLLEALPEGGTRVRAELPLQGRTDVPPP